MRKNENGVEMPYTADDLRKMTSEDLERLALYVSDTELPYLTVLRTVDVGIYDKKGHLIGEKTGGEYLAEDD